MKAFFIGSVLVVGLSLAGHQAGAQKCYEIDTSRPEWLGGGGFVRGDATADGAIDLFDGLRVIYWLGGSADPPPCVNAADAEDDEDIDLFDGLRIIYWIGGNADPPPSPCCAIPDSCGDDPTPGALTCDNYPPCDAKGKAVPTIASVGRADASRLVVGRAMIEGRTAVVPVNLINAEPLVGFSFLIEYDPHILTATALDNADMPTEKFDVFVAGMKEPGVVKVAAVSDMDIGDGVKRLPAGEHQVARVVFERNENTLTSDVTLKVANSVMATSHDRALNHRTVDGLIMTTPETPTEIQFNR